MVGTLVTRQQITEFVLISNLGRFNLMGMSHDNLIYVWFLKLF